MVGLIISELGLLLNPVTPILSGILIPTLRSVNNCIKYLAILIKLIKDAYKNYLIIISFEIAS